MRGAGGGGGSLGSGGSRLAARSEPNLHAPQRPVAEVREGCTEKLELQCTGLALRRTDVRC